MPVKNLVYFFISLLLISCQVQPDSSIKPLDAAVRQQLEKAMNYELADKQLNALSISIVDQDEIIYAHTIGHQNLDKTEAANNETVFRVGSISKLFTDMAIMQKVQSGEIDLDAPIQQYLPDFNPVNRYDTPITLRMLMSHRSGLLREPRIGNYFDAQNDHLESTVESIAQSTLVHEPGSRTKYSNAGIAVVGYVLEKLSGMDYVNYMQSHVLDIIGMSNAAFDLTSKIEDHLAEASMWSYDRSDFRAPTFQLGMAPAGCLYATMSDLGQFLITLNSGGQGQHGILLNEQTLQSMWQPQFGGSSTDGYGIGFRLSEFHGMQQVGHGGAIYGFSTQLALVPETGIGVACASSVDITNTITSKLTNYALELIHASQKGEALPIYEQTAAIDSATKKHLVGHYANGNNQFQITEKNKDLVLISNTSEYRLRQSDLGIIPDGRSHFGQFTITEDEGNLSINGQVFQKIEPPKESSYPEQWNEFIGEYGDDHIILYLYEQLGNLFVLIEWFEKDQLAPLGQDTFAFPEASGMYHGERLIFNRNERGKVIGVSIENGPYFAKRDLGIVGNQTFRIQPVKPIEEIRTTALQASPPEEKGSFKPFDLVDLKSLDASIRYDIRYASENNFMGSTFYKLSKAYLQRPAALAVVQVHHKLKEQGLGLMIHDAYRPWFVTKMFFDATPEHQKIFVADPAKGSRHNRGAAVDLTLYDLVSGQPIQMVAGYDEMTDRSFPFYYGGNTRQRYYRNLLREHMEAAGFSIYEYEWWHFDYKDWESYPIGNTRFEDLEQ